MPTDVASCKICGFSDAEPAEATAPGVHSPRIQRLLNSNEMPLDLELALFQEEISTEQRELLDLEHRIAEMRQSLALLLGKREQRRRNIEEYQRLIHPARRLPLEIVQEIFLTLVVEQEEHQTHSDSSLNPRDMPWVVAQVSTRWRDIATSYHRLWATVRIAYIDQKQLRPLAMRNEIAALTTQLDRANPYPLKVVIFLRIPVPVENSLMATITAISNRWKSLSLVTFSPGTATIFRPMRSALQNLVELELYMGDKGGLPSTQAACSESGMGSNVEFMPSLTTLSSPSEVILGSRLPVSQVTHYRCELTIPPHVIVQLLSQMPQLKSCRVDQKFDGRIEPLGSQPAHIQLNHLQSLDIPAQLIEPLVGLTCPGLQYLQVSNSEYKINTLISFITSSKSVLKKLQILDTSLGTEESVALLEVLPRLRCLLAGVKEDFDLDKLISTPDLAPSLRHLQLCCPSPDIYDPDIIQRLEAARPSLKFQVFGP
ncbi:hypothetical protein C8J56DRAFT_936540 [Mycena floridula]|nr:hypothetical protein C8J56DRAFT_936540 [Mycena floridula]